MLSKKVKVITMTENEDGSRTPDMEYNDVEVFEGADTFEVKVVTQKWCKGVENAMNAEIGKKLR